MSVTLLLTEVIVTFCIASCVLYRYGNWWKHRIFVTVSVLIAWYFSLLIIFILPLDVASVSKIQSLFLVKSLMNWKIFLEFLMIVLQKMLDQIHL